MRTYYVCVLRPSDKYTVGGAICRLTFQSLWVFCTTLLIPNLNIRPLTNYSPSFFPKTGKENKCSASTTVVVTSRKRREKHILLKNVVEKRKKEIKEKVSLEIEHQRSWLRGDDISVVQSKRRSFLHGYLK